MHSILYKTLLLQIKIHLLGHHVALAVLHLLDVLLPLLAAFLIIAHLLGEFDRLLNRGDLAEEGEILGYAEGAEAERVARFGEVLLKVATAHVDVVAADLAVVLDAQTMQAVEPVGAMKGFVSAIRGMGNDATHMGFPSHPKGSLSGL